MSATPSYSEITPAQTCFEILESNALTSKHSGFAEEEEWRVIHLGELD
jgi:hypothetical protein